MARVLLALFIAGAAVAGGLTLYIVWPSLPWTDDGHPGRSAPLHAPELGASMVVLYVPGLEFDLGADDLNRPDAYTRRVFPQALRDLFAGSGEVAFSYAAPGEPFRDGQTRQALAESASVLDAHVRALVAESPADLLLVTHSLGGAVAAYWAATAPADLLDRVRLIVTFASPLDGYSRVVEPFDAVLGWLTSDAGRDLTKGRVIARMRHGVLRADFVQYANRLDLIVPPEVARSGGGFTAWRGLTLTPGCRGRHFNHDCLLWQEDALRHLGETLAQAPPIWSGAAERAPTFTP